MSMATCEMCGTDRVTTFLSEISGAKLRCCTRCIESNNLTVLERRIPVKTEIRPVAHKSKVYTKNIGKMEKEIATDFHIRIKRARETKGWSARELAKRLNLRLNDIQKAEAGVQPADNVLEKLAKALDISLFEEANSDPERAIKSASSRNMTIGDALDEFLGKN
ncbi:MAG TPA: TIGR00270 family protein [Candidatus Poseidoniales archaeon]|jgi:putative transcription factor|nr:MAG TPA: TIGR00270 family protein [Candidatus Poseidoniales archaeon]